MKKIIVKSSNADVFKELVSIGFDKAVIHKYKDKYKGNTYKIFNLKPYEANIFKQLCLSLGFDCAVSRDTITCECDYTDCLLFANYVQLNNLINKLRCQPFRLKEVANLLNDIVNTEKLPVLTFDNYIFDWSRPYIMGILNFTPDSFSDGGKYNTLDRALYKIEQMIQEGADIIDIGGESTRPDAQTVTAEEEISRVIPLIKAVKSRNITVPVSVDTRNYLTAKIAVEEGADIINDVSGLEYDKNLFSYVVEKNIPVVIMHSDRVPAVSSDFINSDVVENVYFDLFEKISSLKQNGLNSCNIIADIGVGFGKSCETNFELLKRVTEFKSLNVPLLLGISRKSFIRNEFNIDCKEADIPTALYSAMLTDVNIHRVHNVKLTKQYLDYAQKIII